MFACYICRPYAYVSKLSLDTLNMCVCSIYFNNSQREFVWHQTFFVSLFASTRTATSWQTLAQVAADAAKPGCRSNRWLQTGSAGEGSVRHTMCHNGISFIQIVG